jgi:MFS family permease
MIAAPTDMPAAGWRDVISGERLPRFALICVGVWLNAAETLMTATIMPSVAADIRGYAWFGWVVAIYLVGSIVASATAGRLALRLGLKRSLALGGVTYALGCAAGALAPSIGFFIAGRLLQGVGGGWVVGLCFVAVTRLFPQGLWSRVLSALAGVWGVASLISPLVGGLFAQAGFWRGAFWLFAAQGVLFVIAAAALVPAPAPSADEEPPPSGRISISALATLTAAILAIGAAGLTAGLSASLLLATAGIGLLALFFFLNARSAAPLVPAEAADPRTGTGAGLMVIFCMCAGTASITAYLPALLQTLYGVSPIAAGYILVSEAMAWTVVAFLVASRSSSSVFIRLGGAGIVLGVAAFALVTPRGGATMVPLCAMLEGASFGILWAFNIARLVANAPPDEQAIASSSAPTMQSIGTAVGSAASGVIANLLGFGHGLDLERARAGGFWLFAAFLPLTALGALAAWRVASPRFDPARFGQATPR